MNDQLLTRRQLQETLGISRTTTYRWLQDGTLPAPVRLGPRFLRWRRRDIEAFLEALESDK